MLDGSDEDEEEMSCDSDENLEEVDDDEPDELSELVVTPEKTPGTEKKADLSVDATIQKDLKAMFDEMSEDCSDNNTSSILRDVVPSEQELAAAAKLPKYQKVSVKVKLATAHLRLYLKWPQNRVIAEIKKKFGTTLQKKQVEDYCSNVGKIYQAYLSDSGRSRVAGGGAKRLGVRNGKERSLLDDWGKRTANDDRTWTFRYIRQRLGEDENPASAYVALSFLKANKLSLRKANIKEVITPSQMAVVAQDFLTTCAHISTLYPSLTVDDVVQLDEIATSLSGLMKKSIEVVCESGGDTTHIRCCDLDGEKKECTGVHFLHAPAFIPPILIFRRGAAGPVTTKTHTRSIFSKGGCMTETIFAEVVIPHIREHAPKARLLILDSATSHITEVVKRAATGAGFIQIAIPAKCTPILQSLDVYYFSSYRQLHNKFAEEAIRRNGVRLYQSLPASERRELVSCIALEAARIIWSELDIRGIFTKLGYVHPTTETVHIRNLPGFTFVDPPAADVAKFMSEIDTWVSEKQKAATERDLAVERICSVEISSGPRKRGRPPKSRPLEEAPPKPRTLDDFFKKQETLREPETTQVASLTQLEPVESIKEQVPKAKKSLGVRHCVLPIVVAETLRERQESQEERVLRKIQRAKVPGNFVQAELVDMMCELLLERYSESHDDEKYRLLSVSDLRPATAADGEIVIRPMAYQNHFALLVHSTEKIVVFDSLSEQYHRSIRTEHARGLIAQTQSKLPMTDGSKFFQKSSSNDCAFFVAMHLAHLLKVEIDCSRSSMCKLLEQRAGATAALYHEVISQ